MNGDTLSIVLAFVLIILVILIFIRITLRVRKYGGSLTTTMFASTYEFLSKDKREAVEEIVEANANKKWKNKQPINLKRDNKN